MAFHIVLVNPEIPPNTGNISRTCAVTGTKLHLVKPLGFSVDDVSVKRAGLDYWTFLDLEIHESLEVFKKKYAAFRMFPATTRAGKRYTDFTYEDEDMFIFGRETAGLPKDFIEENSERAIRIPMGENAALRSLNLSNSAAIIIYEALRQTDFRGLK